MIRPVRDLFSRERSRERARLARLIAEGHTTREEAMEEFRRGPYYIPPRL
jgi:hypothetical protein